ncbi:MAG: heat-shock protein Hsp20 [Candidatus Infernicultor aquiphilus]|uniref:Heat-shock protein Hsp20 n=1 Tax=Candidatus Infernicultor aquiphilus TaxID=1805029 RepID=A0A1J5GXE8_9BACT|nr:Hsp20/alpha crystallin family protein [bacterium]OIP73311.1 MAG: heat-shock protein Hsp20 [Candidatus Atribacteria bacterium CG2_30_33_13]PIU25012.1 MAG: heat-shock protein Hsp20 [Candidatus Atribacteria bacterium CG08_land_8_20_14_0_20_33_29]PIW11536.1 MAG: heat-shock protein Hsp20 [Candidatus Atribacteria bacterium CG17_big_fil_post_rev_8_21_14_2_50_34_11]PIX33840.1 MAG: heat-shock protein Hsp20 [Candidatus Atribacteria bacterium CG_4_8_14_3_um_filter_34_18]PIY33422.1 MAG: heat-shock prot
MAEKEKKEEKEGQEFDFDLGKVKFGGIFKGISDLISLADKVTKEAGEIKKFGEIKGLPKEAKGIYGFSIKTLAGGKPLVETFGNIKKTPKGPTVEEEREPLTDVFDEKEEVRVYAEIPGVNEEDIKLDLKGDILDILAKSGDRKYHKEILLPVKVKSETLISSYKNGILEVKIRKF